MFQSDISSLKKRTFTLPLSYSSFRTKFIKNQQSLFGSFFQIMTNEKLIIVIARVKKDDKSEKSVPLSLKVKDSDIAGINTEKIMPQNLVEISLDFAETIPVLIIAVADDSTELLRSYRKFCELAKATKMPPVESKTIHFVNIEGIQIKRINAKGLTSISTSAIKNFLKRAEELRAFQKQKQQKKPENKKESPESSRKSKPKKHDSKITSDDESKKDSNYHLRAKPQTPKTFKPKTPVKNDSGTSPNKRERILMKLQSLASYVHPMDESNSKKSFEEIIKILNIFNKILVPESHIKDDESIRMIPEKDETKVDGDLTLIEGILPVYSNKYKKAIYQKTIKVSDVEPTILLANIVRYAFPRHWISNVTIRGSGGRKSLISLWNYKNPLKVTVEGSSIPGLGDKRFRALLDHVVRKCGKKSYDIGIEKNLISTFAKALHYSRSRLADGSRKKGESSSSDSDSDSSEYSDNSDNDDIRIVCTPDIDIVDSDDNDNEEEEESDEESLMNSLFDAATVEGNSSGDEQRKSKNQHATKPVTTIEKVIENNFKKPETQHTASQRVDKLSKDKDHSDSKKDSSVDNNNTVPRQSSKFGSIKNIYYNSPGAPKRSNDSSPIPHAKKQKKSNGSQAMKNQALNEGILSQDESGIRKKLAAQTNQDESPVKSGQLDEIFNDNDSEDTHEDGEITD